MEVGQGGGQFECCYGGEQEQRPWSGLCADVLLRILTFLPFVLDQLSFRGVCTFWRAAARLAPAAPEEDRPQLEQRPWLLFTAAGENEDEEKQKKVRLLLDPRTGRTYRMEHYWPERVVEGAACVASRHGWLLYHSPPQSRLFFLNPFSGATIDLPYIESISPASFDGHPTDDDCVVIGIYQTHPHEIIICYCGRGDAYWTLARCRTFWSWGPFTHAVSSNHLFCFMDPRGRLFIFNFLKFSTVECRGPPLNFDSFRVAYLLVSHLRVYAAFVDVHTGTVCVFLMRAGMWEWLLGDLDGKVFYLGRTTSVAFDGATEDEENLLLFDTLLRDGSTCPVLTFGHHHPLTDITGFDDDHNNSLLRCQDPVWIEPRWIEPSPLHDWLLVKNRFDDEDYDHATEEGEEGREAQAEAEEEDDNDAREDEEN